MKQAPGDVNYSIAVPHEAGWRLQAMWFRLHLGGRLRAGGTRAAGPLVHPVGVAVEGLSRRSIRVRTGWFAVSERVAFASWLSARRALGRRRFRAPVCPRSECRGADFNRACRPGREPSAVVWSTRSCARRGVCGGCFAWSGGASGAGGPGRVQRWWRTRYCVGPESPLDDFGRFAHRTVCPRKGSQPPPSRVHRDELGN